MFNRTYCTRKAAIETAIGVANDVPDLCFVPIELLLLLVWHSRKGQEDSTASPTVARLSASASARRTERGTIPICISRMNTNHVLVAGWICPVEVCAAV